MSADRTPTMAEWRAFWATKDEISCRLLEELGIAPRDVLARNAPEKGELEVDGDVVVLLVLDRNERGGVQVELPDPVTGKRDLVHHVERIQVPAERLARYRADLDAVVL